jgi:hypothetical protein
MKLINDTYEDSWVWVEANDHDTELSPHFNSETDAQLWRVRMTHILKLGKVVVAQ